MFRTFLIFILCIYGTIISIWIFRFPLSYKMTNGSYHDLVIDHDFSQNERDGLANAFQIRQMISRVLLFSSALLSMCMYFILRRNTTVLNKFLKVIMIISAIIALLLALVNGIHFVAGPPVR